MSNLIQDMISAARDNNPSAFGNAFKNEVQSRVADGIEVMRGEAVASMLGIDLNVGSDAPTPETE